VAKALGKRYFAEPPPERGFRCSVTGVDGVLTIWDVDQPGAVKIDRAAARRGCRVSMAPFGPIVAP
jgi:hypothetical protein